MTRPRRLKFELELNLDSLNLMLLTCKAYTGYWNNVEDSLKSELSLKRLDNRLYILQNLLRGAAREADR